MFCKACSIDVINHDSYIEESVNNYLFVWTEAKIIFMAVMLCVLDIISTPVCHIIGYTRGCYTMVKYPS